MCKLLCIALVCCLPLAVLGQDSETVEEPVVVTPGQVAGFDDPVAAAAKREAALAGLSGVAGQEIENGYRRIMEIIHVPLTPEEVAQLQGAGKTWQLDPATSELIVQQFVDYLPQGWGSFAEPGMLVDSYGNPIINMTPGLPDWAQRDVDALRQAIIDNLTDRQHLEGEMRPETEFVLGNFIGQAIVRGIAIDDLVDLFDTSVVTDNVAGAILGYLNFYENLKFVRAADWGYEYSPSSYSPALITFLNAHGASLAEILAVSTPKDGGALDGTLSGCYNRSTFARGMTNLSGATIIWEADGSDDEYADISIGFYVYFYSCDDEDYNSQVRVSTNGYMTFFQQGGGALDGTDYTNDAIPSTTDPDGYVAGWWDDLIVMVNQGNTDRVHYKTEGSTGSRVFTVEYFSMSRLGGDPDDWHFFQMKLIEASNNVELHISNDFNGDSIDSATLGMETFDGGAGDCGPNCNNTNTDSSVPNNYRFAPNRPSNDSCSNAVCLAHGDPVSGNTFGATGSDISSCGYNDIHDVWFYYYAPISGDVTFDTCNNSTDFDTTLAVYDACGGNELGCNDDGCGSPFYLQSSLTVSLYAGSTYYVRLAGYNGYQGNYMLTATAATVASGDTCPNCHTIGTQFSGYTTNNSGCVDDSSCGYQDTVDEWFCWTAPITGTAIATTCHTQTDFDTVLAVFDACGGNELDCNDDDYTCSVSTLHSTIDWPCTQGATYYIRLAGYYGATGNYLLTVTTIGAAPPNDNCNNAIQVFDGQTVSGTVNNATNDGSASCAYPSDNPDVWYTFTAPSAGTLHVNTCGTHDTPSQDQGMDTVLSVHTGCPGTTANELDCNDDWPYGTDPTACTGMDTGVLRDSAVAVDLTNGQTVVIRVTYYGNVIADGLFDLNVDFPDNRGDMNCDGVINAFDIDPFVLALTNPAGYQQQFPNCNIMNGDINCDGAVDAFDIDPFVQCLTGGCPPCP